MKEWKDKIKKLKVKIKADKNTLKKELIETIKNLIPKEKFGILFSGGVDSSFISLVCKQLGNKFTCYVVGLENSEDVMYAKKVAKDLELELKVIDITLKNAERIIGETTKLLKTDDVTKVGVGTVVYAAMEKAKKDGIKQLFSGLGSEEIFAGYQRHELSQNVQAECWKGLSDMYERDLKRDYCISKHFGIGLLIPFLEENIIKIAMNIPVKDKLNKQGNKLVLRKIANTLGLKKEYAFRKKRAAQYGSRFDKAIRKIGKEKGFKYKKDYLKSLLQPQLGVLYSSGKDSTYAIQVMKRKGYAINCLININPDNAFSYMYHKPDKVLKLQAEALNLPLIQIKTKGEKEKELKELEKAIKIAKEKYNIEGIVTGALFSTYQRNRIEKVCDRLELKCFNPLWHKNQEEYMKELIKEEFKIIFVSIAAEGLNEKWLGKEITLKHITELINLNKKVGLNVAGEGGEFESIVLNCPIFKKKIKIIKKRIEMENENTGKLIIEKAV